MILTTILDQSSDIKPDLFVSKELPSAYSKIKHTAELEKDSKKAKEIKKIDKAKKGILSKKALDENEKAVKAEKIDVKKTVINENDMKSLLYMMVPGMSNYFERARGRISYKSNHRSLYKKGISKKIKDIDLLMNSKG